MLAHGHDGDRQAVLREIQRAAGILIVFAIAEGLDPRVHQRGNGIAEAGNAEVHRVVVAQPQMREAAFAQHLRVFRAALQVRATLADTLFAVRKRAFQIANGEVARAQHVQRITHQRVQVTCVKGGHGRRGGYDVAAENQFHFFDSFQPVRRSKAAQPSSA